MSYCANRLKSAEIGVETGQVMWKMRGQGHQLSIGVESNGRCMFGVNLVRVGMGWLNHLMTYHANELKSVIALTDSEISGLRGAESGVNTGQYYLEDEGQGHPLSTGVESNARCILQFG